MSISATEAQAKIQALSTEYQKIEEELSGAVEDRQKLEAQLKENEMVKKVCPPPPPLLWPWDGVLFFLITKSF